MRAGRPLTPVITWADTRSAPAAAALRGAHDERGIHARTGAPLHSTFFPAKLRWLRESRPEVWARAAVWCGFGEYLQAQLTGRLTASLSMASGTGLLDQIAGGWDADMLAASGITGAQLPPIDDRAAPGLIAPHAARWPALARVPWHPAYGDGACSNVGSDCRGPRRVALNVGTSAALRVILPEPLGPHAPTPWGLWRYRVDARRALVGGATSEGGNVLAWCRRHLALPDDPAALEAALARGRSPMGTGSRPCPSWPASGARAGGRRRGPRSRVSLSTPTPSRSRALCSRVSRSVWPRSTTGCARWPPPITSWWAPAGPWRTRRPGPRSGPTPSACRSPWAATPRPRPAARPCWPSRPWGWPFRRLRSPSGS